MTSAAIKADFGATIPTPLPSWDGTLSNVERFFRVCKLHLDVLPWMHPKYFGPSEPKELPLS